MFWGTILKRKLEILNNIAERKRCEEMLSALREDIGVDTYLDDQPGGGNCLYDNYKKQEAYEEKLNSLYNVRLLFPEIREKDVPILEYFTQEVANLSHNWGNFVNYELADSVGQAFSFYRYLASHQISKKSIDDFCKIGIYIVNNTVKWDSEKDEYYQIKPISFNMYYEIN